MANGYFLGPLGGTVLVNIEEIELTNLRWRRGHKARVWFLQPQLIIDTIPPYIPRILAGEPTAFELIKATLEYEKQFDPPDDAPTIILLPEFSVLPDQIQQIRDLVTNHVRENTLLVLGLSHLNDRQARQVEDKDLWNGPSENKFTNCALILTGGSSVVHLQPKIVPSQWEFSCHWEGKTIRYFQGQYFAFIVVVCSELLSRPERQTTAASIVDYLLRHNRKLNLMIWLQHNEKPRSPEFVQSVEQLKTFEPTIFVASSRSNRPGRGNNYSVSGAIVPHKALASRFKVLNKRFHYIEPMQNSAEMSRAVLLRYDAHVYRVDTVLADCIAESGRTEKSALFEESQPYCFESLALNVSEEHIHLIDVSRPALEQAKQLQNTLSAAISTVAVRLASLNTEEFLSFFDIAFLPKPSSEKTHHVAGGPHDDGDFNCNCWTHRRCVDNLADDPESVRIFGELLISMAAMENLGLGVTPRVDTNQRTNLRLTSDGKDMVLGLVHPEHNNAEGTQRALWGRNNVSLIGSTYIVLGVGDRPSRPWLNEVNAGRLKPLGGIGAANAEQPMLNAIYSREFWDSVKAGTLIDVLREHETRIAD